MQAVQLTIHNFPSNKQKYHFQSIDLIGNVFDVAKLEIDLKEAEILLKHGAVYTNNLVSIKNVNKVDNMRLCVYDGVAEKGKVLVKWISL